MTLREFLASIGINPSVLTAGSADGILRAHSRKRFKAREMIASRVCAALVAAYLTEPTIYYLKAVKLAAPAR
jgi:hypothetical protein